MIIQTNLSLTLDDQLVVIQKAKALFISNKKNGKQHGLCAVLIEVRNADPSVNETTFSLHTTIPIFNRANAIEHAHANPDYGQWWWDICCPYDYRNRLLFLKWMERQLIEAIKKDKHE